MKFGALSYFPNFEQGQWFSTEGKKTYHVSAWREQQILFTWWAVYCHNTEYEQSHLDSESKDASFFIIPTPEAWKSSCWLSLRMKCQRLSRSLHEHLGLLLIALLSLPPHPSRFPPSLPPFFPLFNFLIPQRSPPWLPGVLSCPLMGSKVLDVYTC